MSNLTRVFKKFPKTFWIANTMELFERWAWYGFYMLLANYLTKSTDIGALGLSQSEKGLIMGVGTALLYFLPLITGAIADRYGYRKVLFISFLIYITGFLAMPHCKSFASFFAIFLYVAIGGALFKPIISATVSKTTDDETSSIGFGIFYMMVNIGAFTGPLFALHFSKVSYDQVFYLSAIFIAVNFPILYFFKEPGREKSDTKFWASLKIIFKNIWIALQDYKLVLFLIIVAGFWSMYYQLFYTLPVFIDQWVDTRILFNFIQDLWPWLAEKIGSSDGTIKAEYITNVDALYIILFQIVVSSLIMKWKPLSSMISGFLVCGIGMSLTLFTHDPFFILGAIFIFGVGEMAGSPKVTEYIGKIAPRDKVALYMGTSFLPVTLGNFLAGYISGGVYGKMADKVNLLQQEVAQRNLSIPEISDTFSQTDYFNRAQELMNMNHHELTQFLWENYQPNRIWMVLLGIGAGASFLLFLYDRLLIRRPLKKNNA
ncbi:MAG: MFS transporter [Bacteroidales bacterium]|jgi:dipeptide/tripeptide permease|nr:MFS transporter [Bacteroidales bacterium]